MECPSIRWVLVVEKDVGSGVQSWCTDTDVPRLRSGHLCRRASGKQVYADRAC